MKKLVQPIEPMVKLSAQLLVQTEEFENRIAEGIKMLDTAIISSQQYISLSTAEKRLERD